jgi:hypothetical protein
MGIAITFLSDIQAGKARAFGSRVSAAALERVLFPPLPRTLNWKRRISRFGAA